MKNTKIRNAEKVDINGNIIKNLKEWRINHPGELCFDSRLELFCYRQLEISQLEFLFKPSPIVYIEPFKALVFDYSKENKKLMRLWQSEGTTKKERTALKQRFARVTSKELVEETVPMATWSPDFYVNWNGAGLYIETKGFPNDAFPIKFKICRQLLINSGMHAVAVASKKEVQDLISHLTNHNEYTK